MQMVSRNTLEAIEILKELDEKAKSNDYYVAPKNVEHPERVRAQLRILARDRSWFPRLTTGLDGGILFVRLKETSRTVILERALEEALGHIDNEDVYDRIMEVLYGNSR